MARIAEVRLRTIKIHRLRFTPPRRGYQHDLVGEVQAYNLPDAIRRWTVSRWDDTHWADALYTANTVTIVTRDGHEEIYAATD